MKRLLSLLCIITTLCLCSCSFESGLKYNPQDDITLNYNNVNTLPNFWLTNEGYSFLEHNFIQSYYTVTKNGKKRLTSNSGYVSGGIQQYDNIFYMFEYSEQPNVYLLKSYDARSKKTTELTTVQNYMNYLVLDGNVYYLHQNLKNVSLSEYSVNIRKTVQISQSVIAFGVMNDSLVFMTKEKSNLLIFRYSSGEIIKLAELPVAKEYINLLLYEKIKVSFTSSRLLIAINVNNKKSAILNYKLDTGECTTMEFDGYIENFVAYDKNSYLTLVDMQMTGNSEIYKIYNDTNVQINIGQFVGNSSMFVGSDNGAYVLEYDSSDLFYYSENQNKILVHKH